MDPMDEFDRRDASEAHSEVNCKKALAMNMIGNMPDDDFDRWYEKHREEMSRLAIKSLRPKTIPF